MGAAAEVGTGWRRRMAKMVEDARLARIAESERTVNMFLNTAASGLMTDYEKRKQVTESGTRHSLPIVTRAHVPRQGIGTGVRNAAGADADAGEVPLTEAEIVKKGRAEKV
jgi:hypothetical protein